MQSFSPSPRVLPRARQHHCLRDPPPVDDALVPGVGDAPAGGLLLAQDVPASSEGKFRKLCTKLYYRVFRGVRNIWFFVIIVSCLIGAFMYRKNKVVLRRCEEHSFFILFISDTLFSTPFRTWELEKFRVSGIRRKRKSHGVHQESPGGHWGKGHNTTTADDRPTVSPHAQIPVCPCKLSSPPHNALAIIRFDRP